MRHRRTGRKLGRNPNHQRALLRSLASALFLTERDAEFDPNPPKVKGRIITTIAKAKEVRPLVEKCITIARKRSLAEEAAREHGTTAERNSERVEEVARERQVEGLERRPIAPAVAGRRRCLQLLGDKTAVRALFDQVASGLPIVRAVTRGSSAWRSRGWATPARRRFWNSSESATAWCSAARSRRLTTPPRQKREPAEAAERG